jgi:hypothetical protein
VVEVSDLTHADSLWRRQPNLFIKIARNLFKLCPYKKGSRTDKKISEIFMSETEENIQKKLRKLFNFYLKSCFSSNIAYDFCFNRLVAGIYRCDIAVIIDDDLQQIILRRAKDISDSKWNKVNQGHIEFLVYQEVAQLIMNRMSGVYGHTWSDDNTKSSLDALLDLNTEIIATICNNRKG